MKREPVRESVWWHIYILEIDNRGKRNRFYWGKSKIYYTGISQDIGRRMGDYLYKRGYGFLNMKWRDARKIPRYVEYFFGTEWEAAQREKAIKRMAPSKKRALMQKQSNVLLRYYPPKAIILRKNSEEYGEVALKVR